MQIALIRLFRPTALIQMATRTPCPKQVNVVALRVTPLLCLRLYLWRVFLGFQMDRVGQLLLQMLEMRVQISMELQV